MFSLLSSTGILVVTTTQTSAVSDIATQPVARLARGGHTASGQPWCRAAAPLLGCVAARWQCLILQTCGSW
ncbi:hypothetical protein Y032_0006g3087 [Ancylostoma ceylanicum]|uniref:Secreted protein n=1 Tax=Ancylostoma ceylanicum TaxID=53326 RepID=A0A016VQF4_9BILA|nr:hypothetical protein Y032_0006g3087 [Ancylostoma ceylanicum]